MYLVGRRSAYVRVESTDSSDQDAGGASGWTIDGVGVGNSSPWSYGTSMSLLMSVNTAERETEPTARGAGGRGGAGGGRGGDGRGVDGGRERWRCSSPSEPVTRTSRAARRRLTCGSAHRRHTRSTSGSGNERARVRLHPGRGRGSARHGAGAGRQPGAERRHHRVGGGRPVDAVLAHVGAAKAALPAVGPRGGRATAYFSALRPSTTGTTSTVSARRSATPGCDAPARTGRAIPCR